MSDKHTPGPWGIKDDNGLTCTVGAKGAPVAKVLCGNSLADARLIAAAPDLLAVLEELVESADYWSEYDVPLGIVERIRSAIAKARGDLAGMWKAIPEAERKELTKEFAQGFAEQATGSAK